MKTVTQLLVLDRRNSALLRTVPVITTRTVSKAEETCGERLKQSARTHLGRMTLQKAA